jgi:hypothetical protein
MADRFYDLIIVGYGPGGSVAANLAGHYGLETAVIEESASVYHLPRAAHFDNEIMRRFRRLGLADEISPAVRPATGIDFVNAAGRRLFRFFERAGLVALEDMSDRVGFGFVDHELPVAHLVAERDQTTHSHAFALGGRNFVADALAGYFTFELREREQDVERQTPHRGLHLRHHSPRPWRYHRGTTGSKGRNAELVRKSMSDNRATRLSRLVDELTEAATRLGLEVRRERILREVDYRARDWACRLREKYLIIIDRDQPPSEQIELLVEALSDCDLEQLYLSPEARIAIASAAQTSDRFHPTALGEKSRSSGVAAAILVAGNRWITLPVHQRAHEGAS